MRIEDRKLAIVLCAGVLLVVATYFVVGGHVYDRSDHSDRAFLQAQLTAIIVMWLEAIPIGLIGAWWIDRPK